MIDANQRWSVPEAIEWVTALKDSKPLWIEEPTSPDDILGHATIAKVHKHFTNSISISISIPLQSIQILYFLNLLVIQALKPYNIGVATGEMCQNRIIFKQLFQANAISYCQIDSARVGGVNENLSIYFMAKKFGIPVCPHAGGVGLCELVQHLQFWDYVSLTGEKENRMIEYVEHLHEHFYNPVVIRNAHYIAPTVLQSHNITLYSSGF